MERGQNDGAAPESALAPIDHAALMEQVIVGGDLAQLSPADRLSYYRMRCEVAGLDPRAQPFQYLRLQGKMTLYATKAATDQLCQARGLSTHFTDRNQEDGILVVTCRVTGPDGRQTEDVGAVVVEGLEGEARANGEMKARTKARRRAVLAHCGLGMMDESEAHGADGAAEACVDVATGEMLSGRPGGAPVGLVAGGRRDEVAEFVRREGAAAGRALFAAAKAAGVDTENTYLMRRIAAEALYLHEVPRIRDLSAGQRTQVAGWIRQHPERCSVIAGEAGTDPDATEEPEGTDDPFAQESAAGVETIPTLPHVQRGEREASFVSAMQLGA